MRRSTITAALTLAATLGISGNLVAQDRDTVQLDFGVYSSNKPSAMVRVFKPTLKQLEARMSESLGRDVDIRMQIAKDYDAGIQALTSGEVDFSRFGPSSYLEAKSMNEDLRILAMESINNEKVFYGIIAVHNESDIQTLDELRGRSFAFGDEGSTIGRFLSQLHLEQNDILASDLSEYEYLGRHDKVGTAVGAGGFDAGALNESTFKKLIANGEPIRELARFSNVTKPWIASSQLDEKIYEALQAALLELDDASALAALKVDGFLSGSHDDYQRIKTAMEDNDRFFRVKETPSTVDMMAGTITVEQSDDSLKLGIEVPAAVFQSMADEATSRVLIELEAVEEPAPAAALPDRDSEKASGLATPELIEEGSSEAAQ